MANRFFTVGRNYIMTNGLSGKDTRVALVMTNTDVDTLAEASINFVNSFSLDEMDGANYVRKALANEAIARDNANVRSEFTADAVTWTALGAGARQIEGILLYVHVTNDTDSIPLAFYDTTQLTANGGDVVMTPNAEGLLQF